MGVVFEMPIILTILMRMKIVKRSYLVKKRRWVYAATIIFALLMPPTDILSLTLLTVPLWFLFEIALLLNKDY
jgi:sec-independent protein translocase protein TatC